MQPLHYLFTEAEAMHLDSEQMVESNLFVTTAYARTVLLPQAHLILHPAGRRPRRDPQGRALPPRGLARFSTTRHVQADAKVELGVVIGKTGRDISKADAESYIAGYTLAIDLTGRNVQDAVKKKGLPWSAAKGYDTFLPIG